MNYELIQKILFKLDAERAHNITEFLLSSSPKFILDRIKNDYFVTDDTLKQSYFEREFVNPIGIAAGFDKNATMIEAITSLGFGFVEVGTVTPKAQIGNEKPRMFRHTQYKSIQNAMGFNNLGKDEALKNIQKLYPYSYPLGVNIGKNKLTENAIDDYEILIDTFKDVCDYLVINISSPNTPNLRDLQNEEFIKELFTLIKAKTSRPTLLKIAPDMSESDAINICTFAIESGASGVIATNTTIDYSLIPNVKHIGGLSGSILREKSFNLFRGIAKELFGKTMLISVGGIDSPKEAYRRIKNGANLIQIYSNLIFGGAELIRDINLGLIEQLKADGFKNITEAIGCEL